MTKTEALVKVVKTVEWMRDNPGAHPGNVRWAIDELVRVLPYIVSYDEWLKVADERH